MNQSCIVRVPDPSFQDFSIFIPSTVCVSALRHHLADVYIHHLPRYWHVNPRQVLTDHLGWVFLTHYPWAAIKGYMNSLKLCAK